MIILYQFPISHFCEKVRWALSFKGLPFKLRNQLPGFHIGPMKRLAGDSSVPIITDGEKTIQGSSNILTYLDETYPERPLTPSDQGDRKQKGPWYARFLLPLIFEKLSKKMRAFMDINAHTAKVSLETLERAVTELDSSRSAEGFLVGGSVTRADLTAAALLAPLMKPAGYGLDWPDRFPDELEAITAEYQDRLAWVNDIYGRFRNVGQAR